MNDTKDVADKPISEQLLQILVCPVTKQPVRLMTAEELHVLNQKIAAAEIRNTGGVVLVKPLLHGLIREDMAIAYPIVSQIPLMTVEDGIPLPTL